MKTKNLFLSMLAMTGMLLLTSCSQDQLVSEPSAGDFVEATFNIRTADAIATRAIGDGRTVDVVCCAVFDEKGAEMEALRNNELAIDNKKAIYRIRLAKGQKYRVAFFAYDKDAAAYDVTDMKDIKILDGQFSNDERRDAFTNYVDVEPTVNAIDMDVTLRRPFAQLNLGINNEELNDAAKAGIYVSNTYIKVSNVYKNFSAYDNKVVADAATGEMIFQLNGIPQQPLNVDGVDYNYLAMNYLLVGDTDTEKSLTDIEFIWTTADGKTNDPTTTFTYIPVQRNYRTNILGRLLTSPADFTIKIDSVFDGNKGPIFIEDNKVYKAVVTNEDELEEAINIVTDENAPAGDYYISLEEFGDAAPARVTRAANGAPKIELTIVQRPGVNLVLDGCNKNFDARITVNGDARAAGTEKLTIKGINFVTNEQDVTFISAPSKINGRYNYSHNVTIEDCTFEGNETVGSASFTGTYNLVMKNCTATNMHSILQAQSCDNTVWVENVKTVGCKNGVSFGNTAYPTIKNSNIKAAGYGVRADGDASRGNLVIENTTVNAVKPVIVRKMTTNTYNVKLANADLTATGLYHVVFTDGDDDVAAYSTPTGTFSIEGADNYNVYPLNQDRLVVASSNQLAAAVKAGATELYLKDGEYNVANCGKKTLTISGSKKAIIMIYNEGEDGCDYGFDGSTVTFNGVSINTTENTGNYKGFGRMNATFNDCDFFGAYCSFNTQSFNNCTFDFNNGYFWTWGADKLTFDGCAFNGNSKCILAHGSAATIININNCSFNATEKGYTSAGDNTAVVEIDPIGNNRYTVNFTGANTKTEHYAAWYRVKDGTEGHTVNGI